MTNRADRIQSCVDHINTAIDVDPWAKELVAEMGKEILEQLNNSNDCISRKAAESIFRNARLKLKPQDYSSALEFHTRDTMLLNAEQFIHTLPSVQPEEAIAVTWINKHLEWLDNCDNEFAQLARVGIRAMVEIWKKDRMI